MIDNNTLYTQYKPGAHQKQFQSQPTEPNLISTSSTASSTSTASCSSSSSTSSSLATTNAPPITAIATPAAEPTRPYFANRDNLFYHSTDNYRYNNSQIEQQKFRDKQKAILEQQQQQQQQQNQISRLQSNRSSCQKTLNVKHSTPVNVSAQVRSIGDMFEETDTTTYQPATYCTSTNGNNFTRCARNNFSVKSNPPVVASELIRPKPAVQPNFSHENNTIIEDEYFHRNFKTNFTHNFHNTKLNFNLQNPVIVPHPAQV